MAATFFSSKLVSVFSLPLGSIHCQEEEEAAWGMKLKLPCSSRRDKYDYVKNYIGLRAGWRWVIGSGRNQAVSGQEDRQTLMANTEYRIYNGFLNSKTQITCKCRSVRSLCRSQLNQDSWTMLIMSFFFFFFFNRSIKARITHYNLDFSFNWVF